MDVCLQPEKDVLNKSQVMKASKTGKTIKIRYCIEIQVKNFTNKLVCVSLRGLAVQISENLKHKDTDDSHER